MNAIKITKPATTLFLLSRTSGDIGIDEFEGLFYVNVVRVDSRAVDDPSKLNHEITRNDWYKIGTNHRVEDGNICRDIGVDKKLAIKIKDVMDFVKEHGECVVSVKNGYNCIEIYDYYRE